METITTDIYENGEEILKDYPNPEHKIEIKYEKEVYTQDLEKLYELDLSSITNRGQASKRFDFVVENKGTIFGIEVNFYSSGGSKLNETARSYKEIATASKNIKNFQFVWITDGAGWKSAKRNLKETYDIMDDIYNIADMNSGKLAARLK